MACASESVSVPEECRVAEPGQSWESLADEFGLDTDNERRGLLVVNILADSDGEVYPGAVICLDKEQREYVSGNSPIAEPTTSVRSDGITVRTVERPELVTSKDLVASQFDKIDQVTFAEMVLERRETVPSGNEPCHESNNDSSVISDDDCSGSPETDGDVSVPVSGEDKTEETADATSGSQ